MGLRIKSKFWIEDETGRPVLGHGRQMILEKIDELGSIKAAARDLGMSYRAVWGKLKATEERLGVKLVETWPGGGPGRGSRLTPAARELVRMFQTLHEQGKATADSLFKKIFKV